MSSINARTVGVALGIDLGIGLACFTIFSVLRIIKPTSKYYEPRTYYQSRALVPSSSSSSGNPMPQPIAAPANSSAAGPDGKGAAIPADAAPLSSGSSSSRNALVVPSLPTAAAGSSVLEMHGMPRPGMPLPPTLPRTLLTWIWPLLRLSETRVIAAVGLDVAMLLRFIRFAIRLSLVLIIWCVGVVFPINFHGRALSQNHAAVAAAAQQLAAMSPEQAAALTPNAANTQNNFLNVIFPSINVPTQLGVLRAGRVSGHNNTRGVQLGTGVDIGSLAYIIEHGLYEYSNLDLFSMANIPTGSPLLWVHLASVYVVTAVTLRMLWAATSSALQVYLHHLSSSSANLDSASHTALITDVPGLPKGTLADKVLHNPLFRLLLPPRFKRRIRATWDQIYSQQNNVRSKMVQRMKTSAGQPAALNQPQQQQQQQQLTDGVNGHISSSNEGENIAAAAAAAAAAVGRKQSAVEIPILEDVSASHALDQQQQQEREVRVDGDLDQRYDQRYDQDQYLPSYPASDTPPPGSSSSSSSKLNQQRSASNQLFPVESPTTAAAAGGHAGSSSSGGSSALTAALKAQADVGGVGGGVRPFSSEWQTAARKLAQGVQLRDYILQEFEAVYGSNNIINCHLVTWTPKAAALVQQYNTTRTALEDLLTSYAEQLTAAAAAAGRARGRRRQQHMKAIKIRKLKYPAPKHQPIYDPKQQQQQQETAGKAPVISSSKQGGNASSPDHIIVMTNGSTCSTSQISTFVNDTAAQNDQQQQQQQQQQGLVASAPASAAATAAGPVDAAGTTSASSGFCCWGRHPGISSSSTNSSSNTGQAISSSKPSSSSSSSSSIGGCDSLLCLGSRRRVSADALEVLLWKLEQLRSQLEQVQQVAEQDPSPAAFITFRTRTALTAAISGHHVAEAGTWRLTAAPPADSLIWGKLGLRFWELGLRKGLVYSVLIVLAITYVVPVTIIQGILQLERLKELPVIGVLVTLPVVQSLLVGVLPGLALRIFVLLLPVILYALNRRAGPRGDAELDGAVATHFFYLQVVVVFLASFITGSLLNQLQLFVTSGLAPILDRLGAGVPQTASFFILYIIFTAFIGRSWGLLRPWGLLMTTIRSLSARNNGSNARRRAVIVGTYRMFGPTVPEHSIILLLGLVFSVIAPLVLVAALIFFCMALLVESYNWVWVFRRPYEGGGRLWKALFRHVFIALYIFQAVMAALLIVKRFVWTPLIIPAFLVTLLVHHIGSRLLQRSWDVLSMKAAHQLDLDDQQDAVDQLKQLKQQQQQQQAGNNPNAGVDEIDQAELEKLCRSQAVSWGEMYRPPAVQLLDQAEAVQSGLRARVKAIQARLAAHNANVEAAVALKKQQKRQQHHHHHGKQQQQPKPTVSAV